MKKCKYCDKEFINGLNLGGHTSWCKKNPLSKERDQQRKNKISLSTSGRKLSDLTKNKISEGRKNYLLKNPDKVPYKLNHSSKISYPERYFLKVLNGFIFQYNVEGTLYSIDFANPEKKIGIEIDGEQHYTDKIIVNHDLKRDSILKDLGWKILRIRWSDYKFLEKQEREIIIKEIMEFSIDVEKKIISFKEMKEEIRKKEEEKKSIEKEKDIKIKIEKITESGINFSKHGWVQEVSKKLNIEKNCGGRWVRKNMPEFYESECFKRKKN